MRSVARTRMVKVKDNWYPCINDNEIAVTIQWFHFDDEETYTVLISAHGNDDFGVELRHIAHSESGATSIFEFWTEHIYDKIPDGITVQWFYEHGFLPS